jgi:DNA-binding transcriptional ArsR family regulator
MILQVKGEADMVEWRGDDLLVTLAALANPVRLRILAALAEERVHVSQLARDLGISRPLLHMHLARLEEAGLVRGSLELSADGRAMKFFDVAAFDLHLTPQVLARAVATSRVIEPGRARAGPVEGE